MRRITRGRSGTFIFLTLLMFTTTAISAEVPSPCEYPLTLEEAFRIALRKNEQLAISGQQVAQAEADLTIATAPLLPQLNATAESVERSANQFSPGSYNDVGVSGQQSLFTGGQNWYTRAASKNTLCSERYRHSRLKQEILFQVASQYYQALLAKRLIEISENQLHRAQSQLDLAKQQQEVGLVNQTAVLRARVEVASAREEIMRAQNQYQIALQQLALELGIDAPPTCIAEPEEIRSENIAPDQYCRMAYDNRLDVSQAQRSLEAAVDSVKASRGSFLPDLFVEGNYVRADNKELFFNNNENWEISLQAAYPLFTGFRNTGELGRAKAARKQAAAFLTRLKQEIQVDVRSTCYQIQTQQKVIKSLQDQLESATANYDQITAQFQEGLVSSVDVVDAQTVLNESENRLANRLLPAAGQSVSAEAGHGIHRKGFESGRRRRVQMIKRMIFMILILGVVFGAIFGYRLFVNQKIKEFMATQQAPPVSVGAMETQKTTWNPILTAVGSLTASKGVEVTGEIPGLVESIHFQSGQPVDKGTLLITLDTRSDQALLASLQASANLAETQLKRMKTLVKKNMVPQSDLDQAEAQYKNTAAQVREQEILIDKKRIQAPFSGILGIRRVDVGQYLSPGTPIVSLQALDPIYADFTLPQQMLNQVREGQAMVMTFDAWENLEFRGKISAIEPRVNPDTRNFTVRATLENPESRLKPGMFGTVAIELPAKKDVIALPQTAISYNPYGDVIFVIEKTGVDDRGNPILTASRRFVVTGDSRGGLVEITEGLTPGERVVVVGQNKLKEGDRVVINNEVMPKAELSPDLPNE